MASLSPARVSLRKWVTLRSVDLAMVLFRMRVMTEGALLVDVFLENSWRRTVDLWFSRSGLVVPLDFLVMAFLVVNTFFALLLFPVDRTCSLFWSYSSFEPVLTAPVFLSVMALGGDGFTERGYSFSSFFC